MEVTVPTPQPPPGASGRAIVRMAAKLYALVILFAFGCSLFSGHIRTFLGETPFPGIAPLLGGLGVGLAIVGLTRIGVNLLLPVERAATALAEMIGPLTTKQAIALAAWSAIGEELLFRGALWSLFDAPLFSTTCLFALVHVIPKRNMWGYPLFALFAGFLLALLRDGTGSVIAPILAHFAVNALNLHFLGQRAASPVDGDAAVAAGAPSPELAAPESEPPQHTSPSDPASA